MTYKGLVRSEGQIGEGGHSVPLKHLLPRLADHQIDILKTAHI